MSGSPIIQLIINLLPGSDHTSVKLSHQVVRRPDDLGCVASKLTINNPTKILNHILLSDTCHSASAFLFVRKYKQGCKIQILTGYLLKRFCCQLTLPPSEIRNMWKDFLKNSISDRWEIRCQCPLLLLRHLRTLCHNADALSKHIHTLLQCLYLFCSYHFPYILARWPINHAKLAIFRLLPNKSSP